MRHVTRVALVLVAVLHLLPLAGVLGGDRLRGLYGLTVTDPNLDILLRHRAVLFGLLAAFLLLAAARRALQPLGLAAGGVSVSSYLLLGWAVGGYNDQLSRVMWADAVAAVLLAVGFGTWVRDGAGRRRSPADGGPGRDAEPGR